MTLQGPMYNADNDRQAGHIRNADEIWEILPKPILMRTNKPQNLEDEKSQNSHFRIGPLGQ
jgi:hypothetical protein